MKQSSAVGGRDGFTLVEVLVAIVILMLVLTVAHTLFYEALISWHKGEARQETRENLRLGLDRMSRELRLAKRLEGTATDKLVFRDNDDNEVEYFINNDNYLVRKAGEGEGAIVIVIAPGVTSLTVAQAAESRLVTLTLQGKTDGTTIELKTSVAMRG